MRISFYIDGFNLYHSIKDIKKACDNGLAFNPIVDYQSFSWLDIRKLCEMYSKKHDLVDINFFTAFPKHKSPGQKHRHKIYMKILKEYLKINVIEGKFTTFEQKKEVKCDSCSKNFDHYYYETTEKQTDTNIIAQILLDLCLDKTDIIAVITNDSDIIPAIKVVKKLNKTIIVITPPSIQVIKIDRKGKKKICESTSLSSDIKKELEPYFANRITISKLRQCILPNEIQINETEIVKNPYIQISA